MIVDLNSPEEKLIALTSLKDYAENMTINLNTPGARLIVGGILQAKKDQAVNFNIEINHNAPNTFSDILIRSVLEDRADVHLEGKVRIKKGAKGTQTFLKEDILTLSSAAKAFALPALEIEENEVKAGHSSFTGPLDVDQLFYLQARGVDRQSAQKMLVKAFLSVVEEKIRRKND